MTFGDVQTLSGPGMPRPPAAVSEALQRVGSEDARLVGAVLAGDTEAFRPLVERYQRSVYNLVFRLMGRNAAEAEDLTQDTFVRAYEHLSGLDERNRFGPWLYRIARSLCRDRLRRKEVERRALEARGYELRLAAIPAASPLGGALAQLPPDEFQVLHLRYFEGCSYDEISRHTGLSFAKVDHLIRKARALLARKITRDRDRERAV
jgi:RNA polymerase sigma-70 factor (ECF subfamily)